MRRIVAAAALVAAAAACERCACDGSLGGEVAGPVAYRAASADVRLSAQGRNDVILGQASARLEPRESGAMLTVAARAGDAGWARGLTLTMLLGETSVGDASVVLQGARCAVRFVRQGALSQSDMGVVWARAKILSEQRDRRLVSVEARCRKLVTQTRAGRLHAPELPDELTVSARLWAEVAEG